MWRRPWVLAIVALLYTCVMAWLVTFVIYVIFDPIEGTKEAIRFLFSPTDWEFGDFIWWIYCGTPTLLMVASQAVFLWPLRGGVVRSQSDGKPLKRIIVIVGFVGAVLSLALFFGIAATVQLLWAVSANEDPADINIEGTGIWIAFIVSMVLLVGSWVVWSLVLYRFAMRRPPATRFSRVVGLLLAGTVLETLVVLPVDIMMRRRTDCYCGTGTFYSLMFSAWALLWLCGPGAYLAITSTRRRLWAEGHCTSCGYRKGPTPAPRCPECGHRWSVEPK